MQANKAQHSNCSGFSKHPSLRTQHWQHEKLTRVVQYLHGSIDLILWLKASKAMVIKWLIDSSFAVHCNTRSHTGATMTAGKGSIYSSSMKQKLNTQSSTKAELVAVNNVLGQIIWIQYLLSTQGYNTDNSKEMQDNESAMLLKHNGRLSSTERTRHIWIRWFFVQDKIRSGEVSLEHCPTKDVVGNFFTNPLQAKAFCKFRKLILSTK